MPVNVPGGFSHLLGPALRTLWRYEAELDCPVCSQELKPPFGVLIDGGGIWTVHLGCLKTVGQG